MDEVCVIILELIMMQFVLKPNQLFKGLDMHRKPWVDFFFKLFKIWTYTKKHICKKNDYKRTLVM